MLSSTWSSMLELDVAVHPELDVAVHTELNVAVAVHLELDA